MCKRLSFILIIALGLLTQISAEEPLKNEKNVEKICEKEPKEEFSETRHEVVVDGKLISYKAVAGNLLLRDEKDAPKASVFFVSYMKEDVKDAKQRPITFCFNGGPGSSSVWLHIGILGPQRVFLTEKGNMVPPYHLVDNEFSILDQTDLVFIDPISTGFSRAIPVDDAKKYHGVEEDIKSVAEFIRLYVTRYNRWDSPKFLAGESYGTTRAAGLAGYLHDHYYMHINGLILISSVLNFQSISFDAGNDLSYLMFLPTYTATAWYHNKLAPDLQKKSLKEVVEESKAFVTNDYLLALFKGDLLSSEEKNKIIDKLARYTGLSTQYIADSNLRIDDMHFVKQLLRSQNRTVGRFDSRFQGIDANLVEEKSEYDPSAEALFGAFTATLNNYIRTSLKWESYLDYKILTNINSHWDYSVASNQYLNVVDTMRSIIVRNPYLRIFVANGYYDMATPFFATEYTFNHLSLEPDFVKHVSMEYYEAGHMMYTNYPSLVKFKKDISKYFNETLRIQTKED